LVDSIGSYLGIVSDEEDGSIINSILIVSCDFDGLRRISEAGINADLTHL
jgi:hypothetical protein